jgi:hypothetical protein
MSGIADSSQEMRTDKCADLVDQCVRSRNESLAGSQSILFEMAAPRQKIISFLKGISAIRLFPMTEPTPLFTIPDRSTNEALQTDWCMIGRDMFAVLLRELDDELSQLRSTESHVKPANPAKIEPTLSR